MCIHIYIYIYTYIYTHTYVCFRSRAAGRVRGEVSHARKERISGMPAPTRAAVQLTDTWACGMVDAGQGRIGPVRSESAHLTRAPRSLGRMAGERTGQWPPGMHYCHTGDARSGVGVYETRADTQYTQCGTCSC